MDRHERNAKLTALLPQIESQSQHWTCRYPQANIDPADCVQEACMSFLRRAETDPAFLNQSDEEITRRCVLDGWNSLRRQQRFSDLRQVPLEPADADGETYELTFTSDESIRPIEDAICASDQAEQIQQIIAGLPSAYQAVCQGLMASLPKGEIMAGLGVAPQNFTWYRQKLQRRFAAMTLS